MTYYLIKEVERGVYAVSKWSGGKEPEAVYEVQTRRIGFVCDCPARAPFCKHIGLVEKWLKQGRPELHPYEE